VCAGVLGAPLARAEVRIEITGEVVGGSEEQVDVRVGLKNAGDAPATSVSLSGELFGHSASVPLPVPLKPGESRSVPFTFPLDEATPGTHAVVLRLEYKAKAGPVEQTLLQPAYVLLVLGEKAEPVVKIEAPEAAMDSVGRWRVALSSLDAKPHRVRLRTVLGRSLRVDPVDASVEVPAQGRAFQDLTLFRVEAPWNTTQGALFVAATEGEDLTATSVATTVVRVGPDPARMPRLRRPLAVVMLVLLSLAAFFEIRRRWRPQQP
jgi:hypothetical protein